MQDMQVWSLDGEDPLEKEMANHSNILAWKTPWTEEAGGRQPWDHRVGHNGMTDTLCMVCSALHKLRKQLILYRIQHPRGLRSVTDFRYLEKEAMLEKRNAELLDNTSR